MGSQGEQLSLKLGSFVPTNHNKENNKKDNFTTKLDVYSDLQVIFVEGFDRVANNGEI